MRNEQLEAWVLELADSVKAGRVPEDSRVEFKAEWPSDARKAARRLGGHANASRGDPVLWVVGLDERRGLTGANRADLATWYQQVAACFDGIAPELVKDLDVPVGDKRVVAMLFDTARAPYVVKNPAGGDISRDVPWRTGTRVDSATREQLLRLLSPIQRLPTIDTVDAALSVTGRSFAGAPEQQLQWYFDASLYAVPNSDGTIVIPYYKCKASCQLPSGRRVDLGDVRLYPPSYGMDVENAPPGSVTVQSTKSELLLIGPGMIQVSTYIATTDLAESDIGEGCAEVSLMLPCAGLDAPIALRFSLPTTAEKDNRYKRIWASQ